MNPDEWARAREVFNAAAQRGSNERDAYLDDACAGDPALRAEVVSLLAAHDGSPDFIERPVFEGPPICWWTIRVPRSTAG